MGTQTKEKKSNEWTVDELNLAWQTFPTSFRTSSSSCGECLIWNSLDDIWDCYSNKKKSTMFHFFKVSLMQYKKTTCFLMHAKP